jgi:hypothetical protein
MAENPNPAEQARLAAQFLAQGKAIDAWSLAATLLAVLGTVFAPSHTGQIGFLCAVLMGLVQRYYAFRVALDADIFRAWAERWATDASLASSDLSAFDSALASLGLGKPQPVCRSVEQRGRAALRLLAWQALALLLQLIVLALAASYSA